VIALDRKAHNVRWWPVDRQWILDYAFESGITEPWKLTEIIEKRRHIAHGES